LCTSRRRHTRSKRDWSSDVCSSDLGGYPAQNKASSVYIIEKDGFIIVLDMGSGALSKLPNYVDIGDIDAVILSHYHTDHIADVGVLQHAKLIQYYTTDNDTILPIYGL